MRTRPSPAKINPAAAPDLDYERVEQLDRMEMEGLLTLQRSRFWLNSFIGELLAEFANGKRVQPQDVVLALSDSIGAIESTPEGSEARKAITGQDKRPMRLSRNYEQIDKFANQQMMFRKRLELASACASFAETASDIEVDQLHSVLFRWRSMRCSWDPLGSVLNDSLKRCAWSRSASSCRTGSTATALPR